MYIQNHRKSTVTMIDNRFIDRYMTEASGEFVKVYLYLLRLSQDAEREFGIGEMADALYHTENDVLRGLRYWEKQGLLQLDFSTEGDLQGIALISFDEEEVSAAAERPAEKAPVKAVAQVPEVSEPVEERPRATVQELPPEAVAELRTKEDFRELLFVSEAYLGRNLTPKDIQLFAYLYDELGFSKDLLEYLVEYCVDGGHKSNRYMETVALNWHQEGKLTVELAKDSAKAYSKENKVVMKAFGIVGRVLNNEERGYVEKWTRTMNLSLELVEEACNITMMAIQRPSFPYTDKILSDWHAAGIRSLEEARSHRENRRNNRAAQPENMAKPAENNSGRNRFQNYQQRNIDYDALIQQGSWNTYGSDES